jgi:hypothetical protein
MGADLFAQSVDTFAPVKPVPVSPAETSAEARASIEPHLGRLQSNVLGFIRSRGKIGATCDEVEQWLDMSHQTASARVHELMHRKCIVSNGKRKTRSGRNAVVWVAT